MERMALPQNLDVRQRGLGGPRHALQGARREDVAASFQASVAAVLADRAKHALAMVPEATAVVVAAASRRMARCGRR